MSKQYQPKTGARCHCRPGKQRDNCRNCEGTGRVVDFKAIRALTTQPAAPSWYTMTKPDDAQGLVIDENTGANIAVTYDPKHAALIAAAPDLLAALKAVSVAIHCGKHEKAIDRSNPLTVRTIAAALEKATT